MVIRLEKIIPLPLLEQDTAGSEVWQRETVQFEQGRSYLIEAPSGKGKTTLLSVIYGMRSDYRGRVIVDRRDIKGFSWKEWSALRKQRFSFIFQGLELFDNLTALENIQLKNSITGHLSSSQIEAVAERLELAPYLHRKAGILSFGQQQRVAILRALCQPFAFLLADECFSHIDRENAGRAYEVIKEQCKAQGAGLILTSLNGSDLFNVDERLSL